MSYRDPSCPHCGAPMSDEEIVKCAGCRRVTSRTSPLREADLTGRDLSGADLRDLDLSRARLAGASLIGAVVTGADLRGALVVDADLTDADLSGANLEGADLRRANLHRTKVDGASLHRAAIDIVYAGTLRGHGGVPDWRPLGDKGPSGAGAGQFETRGGRPIACRVCDGDRFTAQPVVLSSRGLAIFDMEWLGSGACALICAGCEHIVWFRHEPPRRR